MVPILKPAPIAAAILAIPAVPAFRQQGAGQPTRAQAVLEEIIVTARRREDRLQDVPISMTVFNQQQQQAEGPADPDGLLQ